jgi:hypothetical protein
MIQHAFDSRSQLSELQLVTRVDGRWQRAVFGARTVIAGTEHDSCESQQIAGGERWLASQARFDHSSAANMYAV